ncbi:MAG: tyrosine-type recombinase/integrase [Flavobacteriales bacterium]
MLPFLFLMIDDFVEYLRHEKRFSPHTIKSYLNDVNQFKEYSDTVFAGWSWKNVNHHDIRGWIIQLLESGNSEKSVNRKLSTLKTLFNFLVRKGEVAKNPAKLIQGPKIPKRIPIFIEDQKLNLLFDEWKEPNNYKEYLAMVVMELFYTTGIRLSELIVLKDFDIAKDSIKVTGKGNKQRLLPLLPDVYNRLQDYISYRNSFFKKKDDYLFLTIKGNKLYSKLVYNLVNTYLSGATTMSRKSPHILRHSFATHLLNNGAELNAIKDLLGHTGLAATQIYTHNTIDKLRKSYITAHPRAKK